jgi:hypothetical protein
VCQKSHGVIPQPGVIVIATLILILILPQGRLRGGFLDRETVEPLLAVVLIQRLTLKGLSDLTLLRGVFLFLLLSHRDVSRLSSSAILRNR